MAKSKKKQQDIPETHYNIWGYQDSNEVALDISCGIHSSLLRGYFVFAFRSTGEFKRLVVTRTGQDEWMYGIVTSGWTCLVPKISREGVLELVVPDMISRKVDNNIINDFKYFMLQ